MPIVWFQCDRCSNSTNIHDCVKYNYKYLCSTKCLEEEKISCNALPIGLFEDDFFLPKNRECSHEYKQYVGFRESYDYCVKCDQKKG